MEIFVGDLADSVTPADLQSFFTGYGRCSGFLLIDRRVNGRTSRSAYGVIEPEEEGQRAVRELNRRELNGSPVTVEPVSPERRRMASEAGQPWVIEAGVTAERRRNERRQADRRQGERRVADRRSAANALLEPPKENRVSQRRVGERRGGERRGGQRRKEP